MKAQLMVLLAVSVLTCCDRGSDVKKGNSAQAIENARFVLTSELHQLKAEGRSQYDREVRSPAYERGIASLDAAAEANLQPELLIATITTYPELVRLDLEWLDAEFRVSGVRLQKVNGGHLDYRVMAAWTEADKAQRRSTALRKEAAIIVRQEQEEIEPSVGKDKGRPTINVPRTWLRADLKAMLLMEDGTVSDPITVTARTIEVD